MDAFHDIRPVPIDVVLSWPKPNYVNPVRRGPALLIVNGILLPIAMAVVIARLYTRLRVVRSAGLDDLFIGLALVPTIGLAICVFLGKICHAECLARGADISIATAVTHFSWDIHIWDVPPEHVIPSRKISFATQFLFLWASSLVKLSILLFYRRMSVAVSQKSFSRAIWITIVFVTCFHISAVLGLVISCNPVESGWDISIPNHRCFNQRAFKMAVTVINTLTDFVIILLPLPTVWSLRLRRNQKTVLSCIFLTGSLACVAGLIRIYYTHTILNVTFDVTWFGYILWVYIAVEVDVAMICASAPALKPLVKLYTDPSSRGSNSRHNGRGGDAETGNGIRVQKEPRLLSIACQGAPQQTDMRELESEECIIVLQRPSSVILRGDAL
ncbi:MAG: hypothetical protein M1840_009047 [Geoglossum simile]|nr:MAG: hypothetical protein M1840_009047 [Geoglossum simile]